MVIEQFTIPASAPHIVYVAAAGLIVVGVILLVVALLLRNRQKGLPLVFFENRVGYRINSKYDFLVIIGVLLMIIGGFLFVVAVLSSSSSSFVTVGDGYMIVKSGYFSGVNGGNKNVTCEEIAAAFVGQVGLGDFKLHKRSGLNFDDINMGMYTLGNGAKAYLATTNSTCLIVELKSGEYLIVGNQDTQAIANSFSQNVYKLTS